MGLRPVEFLVLPRILATALMMPALVAYADLMGLLGGLFVGTTVPDLGTKQYVQQTQAALALRTQLAQETSTKMMEAMRQMANLTAEAQAEFNKMLGQQMAGTSQEMMENFKKMMSVSGLPGGGQDAFATMQKAFGTAKDAFDQIAKASAAAFNMPGAGKGKSVKVD